MCTIYKNYTLVNKESDEKIQIHIEGENLERETGHMYKAHIQSVIWIEDFNLLSIIIIITYL